MSLVVILLPLPTRQIPLPSILLPTKSIRELLPLLNSSLLRSRGRTKSLIELDDLPSEVSDLLLVKLLVTERSVVEFGEFLQFEFGFGEFLEKEDRPRRVSQSSTSTSRGWTRKEREEKRHTSLSEATT